MTIAREVKGGKISDIIKPQAPTLDKPEWICHCERCGHDWIRRNPTRPAQQCPKCKSQFWRTPRLDNRGGPKQRAPEPST